MSNKQPKGNGFWWQELLYPTNDRAHYVVMKVGGRAPTVAYESYLYAENEARRLAGENPGKRFIIYSAVNCVEVESKVKQTKYS